MVTYDYTGRDSNGKTVQGKVEAASEDAAASSLIGNGIMPTELKVGVADVAPSEQINITFGGNIKAQDLMMFARQMATLSRAGVPLLRAIQVIRDTTENAKLKTALTGMLSSIEQGQSLGASMQQHPKVFSSFIISMIMVGENTWKIDECFEQVAIYLEQEEKSDKRIKGAFRYPMMVFGMLFIALMIVNVFVIPAFKQFFASFGAELPLPTRILMGTSDFIMTHATLLSLGLAALIGGTIYFLRSKVGMRWWDEQKLHLPLVGKLQLCSLQARFCRTFAMTSKAGVPILEALSAVAIATDNLWMTEKILSMRTILERGEAFSKAARLTELFSPLVLQMILVGEETGDMDPMMNQVADHYEREVDFGLKKLTDAIEPILISILAIFVLILALGIFLPMWDLASSAMKGGK